MASVLKRTTVSEEASSHERASGSAAEASDKRQEEGEEAEGEPFFLVVGSRQQEHAAWQWLRESGLQARPLLAGGRWRSLVPES